MNEKNIEVDDSRTVGDVKEEIREEIKVSKKEKKDEKIINVKTNKSGVVGAGIVRENSKTVWVRLPDGNIIKRHKTKHVAGD